MSHFEDCRGKKFSSGLIPLVTAGMAVICLSGCSSGKQTRQQAKQHAAQQVKTAAASAGRELKDITTGIHKTLSDDDSSLVSGPDIVNINYASEAKLATLPGITREQARLIMNNRPYNTPLDLVYKHVVTKEEYERIVNRVDAWDNLWANTDGTSD